MTGQQRVSRGAGLVVLAVLLLLIVAAVGSSYTERRDNATRQRVKQLDACRRGMLDRQDDVWILYHRDYLPDPTPDILRRLQDLESRVDLQYSLTTHAAGTTTYPLGRSTYTCSGQYPPVHVSLIAGP